jgi:antitoxin FitA
MTEITINLPEERMAKLKEMAFSCGISPEELVRAGIERLLDEPEEEFRKAADYVPKKNEELYRRPAEFGSAECLL